MSGGGCRGGCRGGGGSSSSGDVDDVRYVGACSACLRSRADRKIVLLADVLSLEESSESRLDKKRQRASGGREEKRRAETRQDEARRDGGNRKLRSNKPKGKRNAKRANAKL